MKNPYVYTIVKEWLKANGYTALYSEDLECGCSIDDLMPCDFDCIYNCRAGYKYKVSPDPDYRNWYGSDKDKAE